MDYALGLTAAVYPCSSKQRQTWSCMENSHMDMTDTSMSRCALSAADLAAGWFNELKLGWHRYNIGPDVTQGNSTEAQDPSTDVQKQLFGFHPPPPVWICFNGQV